MSRPENLFYSSGLTHIRAHRSLRVEVVFGTLALVAGLGMQDLLSQPAPLPIKLLTQPSLTLPVAAALPNSPATNLPPAQLVTNLVTMGVARGPLTPEQATVWKQTVKILVAKGPAAVPAISEFLGRKQDICYDAPGAEGLLGVTSLRQALFGALEEIGGGEAIATAQKTLQATADPAELVALIKFLNRAEPGKHRAEFARAAKETLALAAAGNWDGRDVAPLFEMMQTFGGPAELADLEPYANVWFNYTPITLAHWPDGAGVPLLIKLAQNANGALTIGQESCQRMLAETAVNYPAAATALEELTRGDKIATLTWPAIGRALGGQTLHLAKSYFSPPPPVVSQPDTRSYHLAYGNQNFLEATLPAAAPAKAVGDRVRLVDRLLNATTNPPAIDALQVARVGLSARLPKAN